MLLKSTLTLSFIILFTCSFSCRSRARSAKVDSDHVRVEISMLNLDDEYKKDPNLNYYLNCDGEWVKGKLLEDRKKVEFFVKKAKANDNCKFKIESLSPPANIKYLQEPGIIFASQKVSITEKVKGDLSGIAVLATTFQTERHTYKLVLGVEFKQNLPADVTQLRAKLMCKPDINSVSEPLVIMDAGKKLCSATFVSGLKEDEEYACHTLLIQRQDAVDYFATVNTTLLIKDAETKTLNPVSVDRIDVTTPRGLTVFFEKAGACLPDEIFDLEKRQCVKKN